MSRRGSSSRGDRGDRSSRLRKAVENWERLVRKTISSDSSGLGGQDDLGAPIPPSLGQQSNINTILRTADEIQPQDPQVARILCEYAYGLAQELDPQSEGRGVLQFKTGLKSVIRQKQSKKGGEAMDKSHDIRLVQEFYERYRRKHDVDGMERRHQRRAEGSRLDDSVGENDRRTRKMKKTYEVSRVLNDVLNKLTKDATPEERDALLKKELKDRMEADAAKTTEFKAYNILPLETPGTTDAIVLLPEMGNKWTAKAVRMFVNSWGANLVGLGGVKFEVLFRVPNVVQAAAGCLKFMDNLPKFPDDFKLPDQRTPDIFDVLQYIFGFQTGNVNNQREHLILLLANAQSLLGPPLQQPDEVAQLDINAIKRCSNRLLDNYEKWCKYVDAKSMCSRILTWNGNESQRMVLLLAMYLLIWGEAANLRFLPECLCYIFHNMVKELFDMLESLVVQHSVTYIEGNECSFLEMVVSPIYQAVLAESRNNDGGKASHAAWRNYDDFNEYFWSPKCFSLSWPWRLDAGFLMKPPKKTTQPVSGKPLPAPEKGRKREKKIGKMTFVEHRTGFHIYHSFHRLWIFLTVMLQGMMVFAFCEQKLDATTFKKVLSIGPTFVVMKFVQSCFDLVFIYGAYSSTEGWTFSRIFARLMWFAGVSCAIIFLFVKMIQEDSGNPASATWYHLYLIVLGSYAAAQIMVTLLMRIPFFRRQTEKCGDWAIIKFIFWVHQDRYFVGRGLYERTRDYLGYSLVWVVILACKFTFSYYFQVNALVSPTKQIIRLRLEYKWHDFISKNNHNALTIAALWAPVILIYYLDPQVWYTVVSSIIGGLDGARARLGEIRTLSMLRKRFSSFPGVFCNNLTPHKDEQLSDQVSTPSNQTPPGWSLNKVQAVKFAPFWNEIIDCLRQEDYINKREKELLLMPDNRGSGTLVQWPLFLLANKVYMAVDMAGDSKSANQTSLWERISKDEYMAYAVQEAYDSLSMVLKALLTEEGESWVAGVFNDVQQAIRESALLSYFRLRNLEPLLTRITALTTHLMHEETDKIKVQASRAMLDLYETVMVEFVSEDLRESMLHVIPLKEARDDGRLFSNILWPSNAAQKEVVKRLHYLLTIKDSSANIPRNLEARRRLEFFTNSLFMKMPDAPKVRKMTSFSVFTPYYGEDVMYSKDDIRMENEDGISILFYLQKIFPDEWKNFLERQGLTEGEMMRQLENDKLDLIELRLWASYRGQTLARTVRGMMYYKKALVLQSLLEGSTDLEEAAPPMGDISSTSPGARAARALAELKYTYVVSCQIYGQQKQERNVRAADILYLMQKYDSLRIAYVHVVEKLAKDKEKGEYKVTKEFYSKLLKADPDGKDQEIYSIKLPGDFKLGEGKPENQNHAIVFTRGDACQTIDMNQDNYFEEALKMRNLLQEFHSRDSLREPTILGIREHVFTGSVSSLAWFMSQQETSFVTIGQRVLARPLKVRMHYGHPDVFDRIFHITRGGFSKSSKTINISEDIFAGFNSTLRQGNITHHEYIQVGKGRDVGLNQIAMFEAKVSGGNGEQILSRDVFRLGQLFDFFRMMSFFYTSVGYYVTTLMTTLVVYAFLYGKAYLALSGMDKQIQDYANLNNNRALESALNTQFLLQIGVFTAVPMIMNFILEQGVLKAMISFITMQLQLCSVFFTFSLGTKTHYFGRTVLHGGAKYQATGRGFVVQHISFANNYRLYSRSHFTKALEISTLLIVYASYGENNTGIAYILLSFSSWFMALSWLFAPYIFNPAGFEWQKTVEDFDDWTNWLFYKGGIAVKGNESWESWWEDEQAHIRTLGGRIWEIILSLRFFFFQYGVVYSLQVSGSTTSLSVYGYSWLVFIGLIMLFQIFTFTNKSSINFQLFLRLFQGGLFLALLAAIVVTIAYTNLSVGDCFATVLVFIPTGWGLLSICLAVRPIVERLGLWNSVRSGFRLYDAIMGAIIFTPIAFLSWFPFVSTFQTRLVFNQAFSRGLEISLILAGNRPNANA